jgi:hypothetical protein
LTHNEGLVMIFNLVDAPVCCIGSHSYTQSPFVNCARISLEELRRDERLQNEPTAKIHTKKDMLNATTLTTLCFLCTYP